MQHPDPDDLALLALGESLGDAVDAHVAGCATCSAEIESFRMTVGLAELSNFGEDAPQPGEHVWQAIAAELGFAETGRTSGGVATAQGSPSPQAGAGSQAGAGPQSESGSIADRTAGLSAVPPATDTAPRADGSTGRNGSVAPHLRAVPGSGQPGAPVGTGGADGADGAGGTAHGQEPPAIAGSGAAPSGRWNRWIAPLAAAVVGIAVGAGAVVLSQSTSDDVTIEAIAPLKPVADGPLGNDTGTLGEAELVAAGNSQQVRVTAEQLPPSPNAYEVWLFGDDGRMVSLGSLNDRTGSFTVPQGINTQEYRVVDISDEAPDGNPAHSGVSLIRGEFS